MVSRKKDSERYTFQRFKEEAAAEDKVSNFLSHK